MASAGKARKTLDKLFPAPFGPKKAVTAATQYFREFFPQAAKANMMLEEIEASKDGKHWLITVGYDTTASRRLAFEVGMVRAYKTLTVDKSTGEVLSAKIRSVA